MRIGPLLICTALICQALSAETTNILARQSAYSDGTSTLADEVDVGFRLLGGSSVEYRGAITFDVPFWLNEKVIQNAVVRMYHFDSWGSFDDRGVSMHVISQSWSEAHLPFDVDHGVSLGEAVGGGNQPQWITWDATHAVRIWSTNQSLNHGLLFRPLPNASLDQAVRFRSRNFVNPSFHPRLDITYANPPPPLITSQPTHQIAEAGDNITFRVQVMSEFPVSFTWYRNGERLLFDDGASLVIRTATRWDTGTYRVSVANPGGVSWTRDWTLNILAQPPARMWQQQLEMPQAGTHFGTPLMAVDSTDAVVVCFSSLGPETLPIYPPRGVTIAKISSTGVQLWQMNYAEPYGRAIRAQALSTDLFGNIYVAGLIESNRLFVLKVEPGGRLAWASDQLTGFGASLIHAGPAGDVTTWSGGEIALQSWHRSTAEEVLAAPAGGIARLSTDGNFFRVMPLGKDGPATVTARVVGGTNLSMLGWGGATAQLGRFELDLQTGLLRTQALWSASTTPSPVQTLVRDGPAGVFVARINNGTPEIQRFDHFGRPKWPRLQLVLPGPFRFFIPALEVDDEGNAFFAAIYDLNGTNDFVCQRINPEGQVLWSHVYSDTLPPALLNSDAPLFGNTSEARLIPDGAGGLLAIVAGNQPEIIRISAWGTRLWQLRDSVNPPLVGPTDLLDPWPLLFPNPTAPILPLSRHELYRRQSLVMVLRDPSSPITKFQVVKRMFNSFGPVAQIRNSFAGSTVPTNGSMSVGVDHLTGDEWVEIIMDGRSVFTRLLPGNDPLAPFSIPAPLTQGRHVLTLRVMDSSGLHHSSAPTAFYARGNPAPAAVSSERLHKLLYVTLATETLLQDEAAPEAFVNSALFHVIATIQETYPQADPELYHALIEEVRRWPAETEPACRVLQTNPYLPQSSPQRFDCLKATINHLVIPGLKIATQTVPAYGAAIVELVEKETKQLGAVCDQTLTNRFCTTLDYLTVRRQKVETLYDAALENQRIINVLLQMGATLGQAVTYSVLELRHAMDDAQLWKIALTLMRAIDAADGGTNDVRKLSALAEEHFLLINEGIMRQLEINAASFHFETETYEFLKNEAARLEWDQQAGRLGWLRTLDERDRLENLQSSLYLISAFLDSSGEGELARKVSLLGENSVRLYSVLSKFNADKDFPGRFGLGDNTRNDGRWKSARLAADVISIGLAIARSVQGSPTSDEMILAQLNHLKQIFLELGDQMWHRFDQMFSPSFDPSDNSIGSLYYDFKLAFGGIDFRWGWHENQTTNIQNALNLIVPKLDALQTSHYLAFQDAERSNFFETNALAFGHGPTNQPIDQQTFDAYALYFYNYAQNASRHTRFAPWDLNTNDAQIADSLQIAGGDPRLLDPAGAINYMAHLAQTRDWLSPGSTFAPGMPNTIEWKLGMDAYLKLMEMWPSLARSSPSAAGFLQTMHGTAQSVQQALRDIQTDRKLWHALFQFYREKAAALHNAITDFEVEMRYFLIGRNHDREGILASLQADFWGSTDQDVSFAPAACRMEIPFIGANANMDAGPLPAAPGLTNVLLGADAASLVKFAELLGLGRSRLGYTDAFGSGRQLRRQDNQCGVFFRVCFITYESKLNVRLSANFVPDDHPQQSLEALRLNYTHPDFHLQTFWAAGYDNCVPFSDGEAGYGSWVHVLVGEWCMELRNWPDYRTYLTTHWLGGQEPPWQALTIRPARTLVNGNTTVQSVMSDSSTSLLRGLVQKKLRTHQVTYWKAMEQHFVGASVLHNAATELSGAQTLLRAFISLAFPESFESDDVLSASFTGRHPLPDRQELIRLSGGADSRSTNSLSHRDRLNLSQIIIERLGPLEATISNRVSAIAAGGRPEMFPGLADIIRHLDKAQARVGAPAPPPYVELIADSASILSIRLFGEQNVPYTLQYSTNLIDWLDFQQPVEMYDSQTQSVPVSSGGPFFIRARVD